MTKEWPRVIYKQGVIRLSECKEESIYKRNEDIQENDEGVTCKRTRIRATLRCVISFALRTKFQYA